MKHKISITIDENLLSAVSNILKGPEFRNKSHFFEVAAAKIIKEREGR
ncbi:MAG: hypothetical protein N3D84_03215 [Candidatus Woesearchaeota archaeon]|nr:hypothetical protein [Candidatus Woesearchaeota archaeon]